jgi:hypothetical protein
MNVLEKEIEDIVWEAKGVQLVERGLKLRLGAIKWRQLNLGSYGIADIVTTKLIKKTNYKGGHEISEWILWVDVIELKKDEINIAAYLQALEYCKGLHRFLRDAINLNVDFSYKFNIILIGKKIDLNSSFCYMADFVENLQVYTYSIDLEKGVRFRSQRGFCQKESQESIPQSLYDFTNMANLKTLLLNKDVESNQWVEV